MVSTVATSKIWPGQISQAGWRALAASWLGWMFDGYETYALVLVMTPAVRQLVGTERLSKASIYVGGLLSVTMLGWAVGGVTAGVLADYIGRKRTLILSILCYAVFAGLTALSWDYWSLLIFRFFTGFGLGAEWGPGAAIVAEFWPAASRGRAAGALHAAYGVGLLMASAIWALVNALGLSAWRYMFVIGVLPAFLLLYVRRNVDEPALWVAANRGRQKAQRRLEAGVVSQSDKELAQFTCDSYFVRLQDAAPNRAFAIDVHHHCSALVVCVHLDSRVRCTLTRQARAFAGWTHVQRRRDRRLSRAGTIGRYSRA